MNTFNKVFRSADGTVFTKLQANEISGFSGNYITVVDNKPIAVVDGKKVRVCKKCGEQLDA